MTLDTSPKAFKEIVKKKGDHVALRKKEYGIWQDISWNKYYQRALSVGSALISMGLQKGDCVSIIGDNCPEWVMYEQAAIGLGLVLVPLYTNDRADNV